MTVQMSRAEWQQAQYRHTMADGSPAVVRWAAGVGTVLEPVEFTDDAPYGVWRATLPDGSQVLVELDDGELTVATRERSDGMWSESVVAEDVS